MQNVVGDNKYWTLRVTSEVKLRLDRKHTHKNQSYCEIIKMLLDECDGKGCKK